MSQKISQFFLSLGMSQEEATVLHQKYYKEYGLAIRGLSRHHSINPLEFDEKCDASLPLDQILQPDLQIRKWLESIDRSKSRVIALTNAFKVHAQRVLSLLDLTDLIESMIYCNYERLDFHCKPEPEFYLCAMKKIGLELDQGHKCYFVDDSKINILAAKELGWESCVWFLEEEEQVEEDPKINDKELAHKKGENRITIADSSKTSSIEPPLAISSSNFDEKSIKKNLSSLTSNQRLKLFSLLLDSTQHNGEILNMNRMFEKHLRLIKDLVSGLPDEISLRIFEKLEIKEVSIFWIILSLERSKTEAMLSLHS